MPRKVCPAIASAVASVFLRAMIQLVQKKLEALLLLAMLRKIHE
jgi:hypothetical protein